LPPSGTDPTVALSNKPLEKINTVTNIEEKVYEIVCEHMGASRDKLAPETSFTNDLGADSLDTVEIVMQFENAFDIQIPDEDAEKIQTVGNAIQYITSKAN